VDGPLVIGQIDVQKFPDAKAHHLIGRHQLLCAYLLRGGAIAAKISDCDCADFRSQAQQVLEMTSGDPHRLDGDSNGLACERLP